MDLLGDLASGGLLAALALVVPGFVSTRVYDLLVPSRPRDFSKSILELIGYSSLNYIAFSWKILPSYPVWSSGALSPADFAWLLAMTVVAPACWPILLVAFSKTSWMRKRVRNPIPNPWDHVFRKRLRGWVIVHLRDGRSIGGWYGDESLASSYPEDWAIYIERLCEIKDDGAFGAEVPNSAGILIRGQDIHMLEFKEGTR